jgi:hypothetical protein
MNKIKLKETKGLLRHIATAKIKIDGQYKCLINGKKTIVISN